jgi:hypothetical protein
MTTFERIQYKFVKKKLKITKFMSAEYVPNPREQKAIIIVKTLILDDYSQLILDPISSKNIITNEPRKMSVIMEGNKLTIVCLNHNYFHNLEINEIVMRKLIKTFNHVLQRRASVVQEEMLSGVTSNLDFIIKNMDPEKQES